MLTFNAQWVLFRCDWLICLIWVWLDNTHRIVLGMCTLCLFYQFLSIWTNSINMICPENRAPQSKQRSLNQLLLSNCLEKNTIIHVALPRYKSDFLLGCLWFRNFFKIRHLTPKTHPLKVVFSAVSVCNCVQPLANHALLFTLLKNSLMELFVLRNDKENENLSTNIGLWLIFLCSR